MSGSKIVADTNILIYLLEGSQDLKEILADFTVYISFISEIELHSKPGISQDEKRAINGLLEDTYIIDINNDIKQFTIANRNKYRLKLPDGMVLATSQWLDIPLLTSDKSFDKAEINDAHIVIY